MSKPPMAAPAPRYWTALALTLYVTMIAWGTVPGETHRLFGELSDKLLHATAYGTLAALFWLGQRLTAWPARGLRVVMIIGALGALDEVIQFFEPHRTSDLADWATDVAAAIVVVIAARAIGRLRPALVAGR